MRKFMLTLGMSLLAAGAALSAAPQSGGNNDTGEFKALTDRLWAAWSTLDPAKAAPMYDQSATAVFFDLASPKYNGWKEYQDGAKQFLTKFPSVTFVANDDLKAMRQGKFAWTSGTFHGTIQQKDGTSSPFVGRHTAIWEKRGAKWIIVHEHVSFPLFNEF